MANIFLNDVLEDLHSLIRSSCQTQGETAACIQSQVKRGTVPRSGSLHDQGEAAAQSFGGHT